MFGTHLEKEGEGKISITLLVCTSIEHLVFETIKIETGEIGKYYNIKCLYK